MSVPLHATKALVAEIAIVRGVARGVSVKAPVSPSPSSVVVGETGCTETRSSAAWTTRIFVPFRRTNVKPAALQSAPSRSGASEKWSSSSTRPIASRLTGCGGAGFATCRLPAAPVAATRSRRRSRRDATAGCIRRLSSTFPYVARLSGNVTRYDGSKKTSSGRPAIDSSTPVVPSAAIDWPSASCVSPVRKIVVAANERPRRVMRSWTARLPGAVTWMRVTGWSVRRVKTPRPAPHAIVVHS